MTHKYSPGGRISPSQDIYKRKSPVPPAGFELAISGTEWPQTCVLEHAATEIGCQELDVMKYRVGKTNQDWRSSVRRMKYGCQVNKVWSLTELVTWSGYSDKVTSCYSRSWSTVVERGRKGWWRLPIHIFFSHSSRCKISKTVYFSTVSSDPQCIQCYLLSLAMCVHVDKLIKNCPPFWWEGA